MKWKWVVRGYYADDVQWPKEPGGLALEVMLATDGARDLEVSVFEARDDIGSVTVNAHVYP